MPSPSAEPASILEIKLSYRTETIQVRWESDGKKLPPYHISRREVGQASDEIRQALSHLEAQSSDVSDDQLAEALRGVAMAGRSLYRALFNPADSVSATAAAEVRRWFEEAAFEQRPQLNIQFVHDPGKEVAPWGLTFTERPGVDIEGLGSSIDDYEDFWCLSYACAVRGQIAKSHSKAIDENIKVGVIIEERDESISQFFQTYTAAKSRGNRVRELQLEGIIKNNIDHVKDSRSQSVEYSRYLYINLRSDGSQYNLSGEELSWEDLFDKNDAHHGQIRLLLLDGDAVIRNDRGSEWVELCMQHSSAGCIAVEVDVENISHKFAGWKIFKDLMATEEPLVTAFASAKRKFWPISLLYGLYCNPLQTYLKMVPPEIEIVDQYIEFQRHRLIKKAEMED